MAVEQPNSRRPAWGVRPSFPAWRHRNYRLYFTGQLVSMTGTWLQMVAQGWLVWQITRNPLAVGTVTAAGSIPMLLLSLVGGTLADRVDRRRLLLVTQSLSMLFAALLGWLSMQPGLQVWHVAAVAACMGIVAAFDMPARQAFVVGTVDRESLMNAIALNSMLFNSARVVGPAVASALIAIPWIGVTGCFFLNSASYVAALIAIGRIRIPDGTAQPPTESPVAAALAGIRYVAGNAILTRLLILLAVVGVFGFSISVLMPSFADNVLGGGAGVYGMLMTANGVGAVLGSLVLAGMGDTPHRRKMVYGGVGVLCLGLLVFSLSRWLPLSLLALGVAGVGTIVFSATGNTVVQTSVPDELRGRVMGLWTLVFAGSTPIGSLQAGALAQSLGAPAAIQVGVAAMLLCGALVLRNSERARRTAALRRAVS